MPRWFALDYCVTGTTAATRVQRRPGDLFEADAAVVGDLPERGLIRSAPDDDPADEPSVAPTADQVREAAEGLSPLGDMGAGDTDPVQDDDPPSDSAPEDSDDAGEA